MEATPPRAAPLRLPSPSPSSPGGETPVHARPKLSVERYGSEPEPRTFSPLPPSSSPSSSLPGAPSRSPRPCFPLTGALPCCPPALRLALPAGRLLPAGPGAECRRRCLRAAQPLQLPGPADPGAAPSRRSSGEARWLQLLVRRACGQDAGVRAPGGQDAEAGVKAPCGWDAGCRDRCRGEDTTSPLCVSCP